MSEPVIIKVRHNGPFLVTGPATLVDVDGNTFDVGDRGDFVLCRCGHSGKRPFCDGSHKQCGFQSAESATNNDPTKD